MDQESDKLEKKTKEAVQNKTAQSHKVPFYVDLPESERQEILDRALITGKDDQLLFQRICDFALSIDSPIIKPEPFFKFLLLWAEESNNARFRHLQNSRRLMIQLATRMQEKKFCQLSLEEQEIVRIQLTDPEEEALEAAYAVIKNSPVALFPVEESLPFGLSRQNKKEITVSDFNQKTIREVQKKGKVLCINFIEGEGHLLVPSSELVNLVKIAQNKLRHFLFPGVRTKFLDDVVKDLKIIMPENNTSAQKVLNVLGGEEEEAPMYLLNVANKAINVASKDKDHKQKKLIMQSAKIIKAYKTWEEEKQQEKKKSKELDHDSEILLNFLKDQNHIFSKIELYQLASSSETFLRDLQTRYSGIFPKLVQHLTEKYTVIRTDDENGLPETVPILLCIRSKDTDYFVHRDTLIPALEAQRMLISTTLNDMYKRRWSKALLAGKVVPPMRFEEFFEKEVHKIVQRDYPVFVDLLSAPTVVYNTFFINQNKPAQFGLIDNYFVKRTEPIFLPYHRLLELNRNNLYQAAYSSLPWTQKLPIVRLFIKIWRWITGFKSNDKDLETQDTEPSGKSEKTDKGKATSLDISEWKNGLRAAEAKIAGVGQGTKVLPILEERWNLKLGPARKEAREMVESQAVKRAHKILKMMKKVSPFLPTQLLDNLESSAESIVKQYNEVHDKDALKEFIMLTQIKAIEKSISS